MEQNVDEVIWVTYDHCNGYFLNCIQVAPSRFGNKQADT